MKVEYADALTRSLHWGRLRHSRAPPEQHGAFSRAVARLVAGLDILSTGEAGGPSMRERAVQHDVGKGPVSYETALELAEELCYGALTLQHARHLSEGCVDDAPCDVEAAVKLLQQVHA